MRNKDLKKFMQVGEKRRLILQNMSHAIDKNDYGKVYEEAKSICGKNINSSCTYMVVSPLAIWLTCKSESSQEFTMPTPIHSICLNK